MTANLTAASPLAWALESVRLLDGSRFTPYPYQAAFLADRLPLMIVLKSRQVGISLGAAVLVAHEALHKPNVTALIVSRDGGAAAKFLATIYDLLDALDEPPEFARRGVTECQLANGSRIVSQPATAKAGRGYTATLVVLDEVAFMEHDARIYRAVLPTLSRGGRIVVISTPNGQANLFYRLWHGLEGGAWSKHRVHWQDCPAFDEAWYARERPKYTAADWASEYDLDFLTSGLAVFDPADVDAMRVEWGGLVPPSSDSQYVTGWDIGRRRDATVGITVDASQQPLQVVAFARMVRANFATIQSAIDQRAEEYGGVTFVESNSIGDPVIEALRCSPKPFATTARSKPDALTNLARLVENGALRCGVDQVLSELKAYQWDDQRLVQDCVMALAICVHDEREHGRRGGVEFLDGTKIGGGAPTTANLPWTPRSTSVGPY